MEHRSHRNSRTLIGRRNFLGNAGRLGVAATASALFARLQNLSADAQPGSSSKLESRPKATADTCIFVWLAGGMCHIDTFDPKVRGDGKKVPGSYYKAIKTAVPGIELCEYLPRIAERMDRFAILRTLHQPFSSHTRAVDFMHKGRSPTGTLVYPSIGSIVAHQLGGFDPKAPAYVVVGYPMEPRGPGFLGGKYNYVYLTDTEAGPAGLQRPKGLSREEYENRLVALKEFSRPYLEEQSAEPLIDEYVSVAGRGFEMMSDKYQAAFSLEKEPAELREAYGEEFGQRLLLSRRLVEHGVRFVECSFNLHFINAFGWDAHSFAQKSVHLLIQQLDTALAVLVDDLDKRKLFERTLVIVATDFGRPPEFDGQGGRGHQATAFSAVMLGGGVKGGRAIGLTDELGKNIVERPVSIPDFHATIHRALGIDPEGSLLTPDRRPVPITDFGQPVEELFA